MSKRAAPVVAEAPAPRAGVTPRISGITYSLAGDRAFSTRATYRYAGGHTHPAEIRVDGHRYDLLCALAQQQSQTAGPEEVAQLLHDVYYCLYAPRPVVAIAPARVGQVPDRL